MAASASKIRQWTHVHLIVSLLVIGFLLTLFIGALIFIFVALEIPDISSLASYRPPVTTVIVDDRGKPVDRIFSQYRFVTPLAKMPELLPKAFVAAEDARFYDHSGVDGWSVIRALLHNIRRGSRAQGGSTITQQVARSLLLSPEKTYSRKIKEAILAYRIDKFLTKDEILHVYLNQIYLGEGAYGVEAAARTYFDKHVGELNLAEISLLAGLPQAPSRYSPFTNFKMAQRRQMYVLNRMAEEGFITPTAARKAYEKVLSWKRAEEPSEELQYFIQHVKNYIEQKYGWALLHAGGLTIHTTLDCRMQRHGVKAIQEGIDSWKTRQGNFSQDDVPPQAALVAMEVATGRIKALVGGSDFSQSQFNRATQARRQPGSAFKPIIYAAALQNDFHPASCLDDAPIKLQGSRRGEIWQPQNFDKRFHGLTTLRNGLIHSRNIVTIKLLQEVGVSKVIDLAHRLGIRTPLSPNLSLALGSSDVTLLDLTTTYAGFANGGKYIKPAFIKKIVDRDGNILEENSPQANRVLDEETAYQITNLLRRAIEEGTGKNARGLSAPAAGKTGTSDQAMDAWFIGYTPTLAVGVWMGYDQKISLGERETGGRAAAPVWLAFLKTTKEYLTAGDFVKPAGITFAPINSDTGNFDTNNARNISWEAFRKDDPALKQRPQPEQIPAGGG